MSDSPSTLGIVKSLEQVATMRDQYIRLRKMVLNKEALLSMGMMPAADIKTLEGTLDIIMRVFAMWGEPIPTDDEVRKANIPYKTLAV